MYLYQMRLALSIVVNMLWLSMQAQTAFSVDTNFVAVSYPATAPVFYPWIVLTNNTPAPLEMRCVKVLDQKPSGWQTWLEDVDSAYQYVPDTSTFTLPTDTQDANYLIVSFHPYNVVGRSTVKLKLYPANDPADSVVLTFQGNAYQVTDTTTGINEKSWLGAMKLYPQPTQGVLHVSGSGLGQVKQLWATNALGQAVQVSWDLLSDGIIAIQTHMLPRGMYFLELRDGQGRSEVKRFIKE